MTYVETLSGIDDVAMREVISAFLGKFKILEINTHIANLAIVARRKHKLSIPNALILATAQNFNGLLVTRNTKVFSTSLPLVRIPYTL